MLGAGADVTILVSRVQTDFNLVGLATIRDLTIHTQTEADVAITVSGMDLVARNIHIMNDATFEAIAVTTGGSLTLEDSAVEIGLTQNIFGGGSLLALSGGGEFSANNIRVRTRLVQCALLFVFVQADDLLIRNSEFNITYVNGGVVMLRGEDDIHNTNVLDNNVVNVFAETPQIVVTIYSSGAVTSDARILSHANVYRDRNNNINEMFNAADFLISLDDFFDINA